jgi:hypothetical protein
MSFLEKFSFQAADDGLSADPNVQFKNMVEHGLAGGANVQFKNVTGDQSSAEPDWSLGGIVVGFISAAKQRSPKEAGSAQAPARPRITVVPNLTRPKQKGEWAESFFETCALALEFNCAKPAGDSAAFDRITEHEGNMLRVQVKSAWETSRNGYTLNTAPSDKSITYTDEHIDVFAGLVVPEDTWYIIPVSEIPKKQKTISVYPGASKRGSQRRYEKFRECWHLLKLPARLLRKLKRRSRVR